MEITPFCWAHQSGFVSDIPKLRARSCDFRIARRLKRFGLAFQGNGQG